MVGSVSIPVEVSVPIATASLVVKVVSSWLSAKMPVVSVSASIPFTLEWLDPLWTSVSTSTTSCCWLLKLL